MKINQSKMLDASARCPVELERRLTHKYASGYSYLDEHEYLGVALPIAATKQKGDDEYWRNTMVVKVEAEDGVLQSQIIEALDDTFSGGGCRHEHDCCGCVSTSVNNVRPMKDGHYALRMSYSRNI